MSFYLILGVTLLFFALTRTQAGRMTLLRQAEQQFAARFEGTLEVGAIEGNVVYRLLARNVVFRAPDGTTVATVDSIHARPTWAGLLRRSLDFDRLEIVGARVHLRPGAEGAWNIEQLFRTRRFDRDSVSVRPSVILPRLSILRSSIDIASPDGEMAAAGRVFDYMNSGYLISEALVATDWAAGGLQVDVIRFRGAIEDRAHQMDLVVSDAVGQLVFDEAGVRLNELSVATPYSSLEIVGDIRFTSEARTLAESRFDGRLEGKGIHPADLSRVFPGQPFREPVDIRVHASGSVAEFAVREAEIAYGRSTISLTGTFGTTPDSIAFDLGLTTDFLSLEDVNRVLPGDLVARLQQIDTLAGDIWAQGAIPLGASDLSVVDADVQLDIESGAGAIAASGFIRRRGNDAAYQVNVSVSDLDASRISGGRLPQGSLTGDAFVASSSVFLERASGMLRIHAVDSRYDSIHIDSLNAAVSAVEGRYDGTVAFLQGSSSTTAIVAADLAAATRVLSVDASTKGFNLGQFLRGDSLETRIDGRTRFQLERQADLTMATATVETLGGYVERASHRVALGAQRNTLELSTGETGLRANLNGDHLDLDVTSSLPLRELVSAIPSVGEDVAAALGLLVPRSYALVEEPEPRRGLVRPHAQPTTIRAELTVDLDSTIASILVGRDVTIRGLRGTIEASHDTAGFRSTMHASGGSIQSALAEIHGLNVESTVFIENGAEAADISGSLILDATSVFDGRQPIPDPRFEVALDRGVLKGTIAAGRARSIGPVDIAVTATFGGGVWNGTFDRLAVGAAEYNVTSPSPHVLRVFRDAISTPSFTLVSPDRNGGTQRLTAGGTWSSRPVDTLSVDFADIDLDALSTVLDFSTRLSGSVNGRLDVARAASSPTLAGNGTIADFGLDGRVLGDLSISSRFLGTQEEVSVSASLSPGPGPPRVDPSGADAEPIASVENDLSVEGSIRFSGEGWRGVQLDLSSDIRRADLFFFEYIFPHTIDDVVGRVYGTGHIRGSLARLVFDADLAISDASFTVPEFNLSFGLDGLVTVDRDAIRIRRATVLDSEGGSAVLAGDVNFNDYRFFSLNLAADLDRMQIMNIANSRDLPFYGMIRGSGHVTLDGPISGATLRAPNARTTPESEVFIPIVEPVGTADRSFIVFADSAGNVEETLGARRSNVLDSRPVGERSFLDGLELDLNVLAPPGSTIHLVIDPLLGDVINANGTGSVQIRRQGGEFSTFGSLEVTSGDYLFTAGDVFVRRFLIDGGGTITWDGDPTNAILDIPASYRTRASRAGLPGVEATGSPIPLIVRLQITGRVATPQVDLFLEVDRSNRDLTGNYTALEAILNQPSRSTEYATSVLVTNSFLLTTSDTSRDVLTSSAFNSVSHLVSSQINRYLNEALPNVDFSFGVQGESTQELGVTYGIALRLLDERLVIRGQGIYQGQGTTTGSTAPTSQALEGEFVVEMRLNPTVSVEVFYRREGDVLTRTASPTGTTGAGITYRTEFSTWRGFFTRIFGGGQGPPSES